MLILSFSGQGENSLTLKSLEVLEHHKDVEAFDKVIIKPTFDYTQMDEVIQKMQAADAIIWAVSPFHMNIPSHMIRFFEECRKRNVHLNNVNTFFTTNMRVCDTFLSTALERQIRTIADKFVQGLSFATPDMINRKMALYTIATPDKPPKQKGLFGAGKPTFYEGEGLKTAVQWYKIVRLLASPVQDMKAQESIFQNTFAEISEQKTVLFVDMDESADMHTPFVTNAVN